MPAKKSDSTDTAAIKPTRKPSVKKTPAEKLATAPAVAAAAAGQTRSVLRMKELIDAVAKATGSKKAANKAVIEATLAHLGTALADGAVINLPGLGKAQVSRRMDKAAGGEMLVIKLRRLAAGAEKPAKAAKHPLAEDGEDS